MIIKFLPLLLLPLLGMGQTNANGGMPLGGNTSSEKLPLEIKRNALFNLEELKVRWKKAALENCPGVPCPTFSVPGPVTSITATPTGPNSASVSFGTPASNGGSPITGYIVTATPTSSAPAKRKSSSTITVEGEKSPIDITGLMFGVNYIFSVIATNATGGSPPISTTTTVTPCTLNTAGTASSSPTLTVNTALTPSIMISTTGATGIGTATSLPAGVTASWSSNVITISGTPTATGSFSYEIPLTGGCGSVKAMGSITVSGAPACAAAAASTSPTLTVSTLMTNITHTTTGATGIGSPSGLPTGVTAAWSSNTITISGTPTNTGTFNYTIPLTGTSCSSVNATGTITVTACGSVTSVTIEGYSYPTVSIGTQCWTKENLRVTMYNDGTLIPDETENTSGWGNLATGARSKYVAAGVTDYVSTYGYLYNWFAAAGIFSTVPGTTPKNICPLGWHVPTDTEWSDLTSYLGQLAGAKLKSTSSLWNSSNTTLANNLSGFSALPGGSRINNGGFFNIGNAAQFWGASVGNNDSNAPLRLLLNSNTNVAVFNTLRVSGLSVRCLKD